MKTLVSALFAFAIAVPAYAQTAGSIFSRRGPVAADEAPRLSLRPYFLVTGEELSARNTFDAAFGSAFQPFFGAGVELATRRGWFVDVAASRFSKDGHRAFFFNNQAFDLGIPLTSTVTAAELTGGYRFLRLYRRVIPYAGAGVGSYAYKEVSRESTNSSISTTDVDSSRAGFLLVGGAEIRLHRWIGAAVDAQYTRVTGILGNAGVSQQAGEKSLGGTAIRLRVIVGR